MLYNFALAVAPLAVLANKKFFLPITKGLIALSAALLLEFLAIHLIIHFLVQVNVF